MVPSTRHTRPWTRSMASATVATNFSTTARTIGQAGHETQRGKRRDIPQGTPTNSSAEIRAISVAQYNPHDFGRPLACSTARSMHCALVAPAPASATTSDRWYGDGNGSPGRREFSGRISRILTREPLPSVATRRSPTTFLVSRERGSFTGTAFRKYLVGGLGP